MHSSHHDTSTSPPQIGCYRRRTALSRLADRMWENPPRPPTPPMLRPAGQLGLTFRVRVSRRPGLLPHHTSPPCGSVAFTPNTSLTPISAFPPEILADIFSLLAIHCEGGSTTAQANPLRGIGHLMLVCRRWRSLIVDTSTFWRHIATTRNRGWISLCLERSRDCLLDLHVLAPAAADPDALALVLPHARRVRSLCAHVDVSDGQLGILTPLFAAGMPALEQLELVPLASPPNKRNEGLTRGRVSLPRLQILIARDSALPPLSRWWRSLRVLSLSRYTFDDRSGPSSADLLHMLALNPTLEELSLQYIRSMGYIFDEADSSRVLPSSLIVLRRLRKLVLLGFNDIILTIVAHLVFPHDIPDVDVRVCFPAPDATAENVSNLLLPCFRPVLERMRSVTFVGSCETQPQIYSPHVPSSQCATTQSSVDGRLSFLFDAARDPNASLEPRLQGIAQALSTVAVRSLTLNVSISRIRPDAGWVPDEAVALEFWGHVLDAFTSLERLLILVYPVTDHFRIDLLKLIDALRPISHRSSSLASVDEPGSLELPRCPLLSHLAVHGRFGVTAADALEVLDALSTCVKARVCAAAPLVDLEIHFWFHDHKREPLEERHCTVLQGLRELIGGSGTFVCKFGYSPGCRRCHR
ncbi:hypothetical protein C8Q77DRAFT_1132824 [Trametes polyzona]|nr:hypothetical protein C8Q77DRAFT_1132824 [Trametes polyzona]